MNMKAVVESPLSGDFVRNFRYLLWCCRALWLHKGLHAIGSHLISPWFMDDTDEHERTAGINNPWVWDTKVPHFFFTDFGLSRGMELARERCEREGRTIPHYFAELRTFSPGSWAAFERGEWPPHTPGFEVAR